MIYSLQRNETFNCIAFLMQIAMTLCIRITTHVSKTFKLIEDA